ncbi:TIGR02757 family protein [Prevotella jejuni]|uniref:TIGR02757 family protein n=1 Tax=Prevotella jejuni TaxID=1177574 RepID=UPI0020134B5D|nr:TIGR02757 family protein [Prevotella jejuni]
MSKKQNVKKTYPKCPKTTKAASHAPTPPQTREGRGVRRLLNKTEVRSLRHKLLSLANKYEVPDFLNGDPSWFMHQVIGERNQETIAFIASCLSYGSRNVFMPRIQYLLDCSRNEPYKWIKSGKYKLDIPNDDTCFYRLYTNAMMYDLFNALQAMYEMYGDMKNFIRCHTGHNGDNYQLEAIEAVEAICHYFQEQEAVEIVPKNASSSCKRVCMFLRWMVRTDSPVDLGIWSDLISLRSLIMPLDTHVIQQSLQLGLITSKTTSMSVARKLTDKLLEIFPDDPLKADFALFGYGVNQK